MHEVFAPTFCVRRMSRESLERAALTPYRFASKIRTMKGFKALATDSIRTVKIPVAKGMEAAAIRLLPGGRFILVENEIVGRFTSTLDVRDLGYGPDLNVDKSLVVSFDHPAGMMSLLDVHPTPDALGVYVFIKTYPVEG
jgi:hypothetical protein